MDAKEMMVHPSIAEIHEAHLVEYLLSTPSWRLNVLGIHGIPNDALDFQRVLLKDVPNGGDGDIDILLCSPYRPDLATAVEVKRIKVGAEALRSEQPNKLHEYKRGIKQANDLARIGFCQVYLFVFVVIDSRKQNRGKISYAGASQKIKYVIEQTLSLTNLDPRVGLLHYEFVQPMDYTPFEVGTSGAHLKRLAQPVTQPDELTEWVAQFIANHTLCMKSNNMEDENGRGN